MDKSLTAALVIAGLFVLLALMLLSWRSRRKRQSSIRPLEVVPADPGKQLGSFEGLYLATTPVGEPLNRIAVRGLGFRSRTTITVYEGGIALPFTGTEPGFIPTSAVREISRATWTIDRAVEPEGLSVISWSLGDYALDSYFRLDSPQEFLAATAQFQKQTGKAAS